MAGYVPEECSLPEDMFVITHGDCVPGVSDIPLLFCALTLHLAEELRGELESVSKDSSWSIATASHSLVSFHHTFGTFQYL